MSGTQTKRYATDLSDEQWNSIRRMIPPGREGGRPRTTDMREVVNALLYMSRTGCQWRLLPSDFPCWVTVYHYFRRFHADGTWERINRRLREKIRVNQGREAKPSAAIIDSQTVKTTEKGGFAATMRTRRSVAANVTS
jgi:transposase